MLSHELRQRLTDTSYKPPSEHELIDLMYQVKEGKLEPHDAAYKLDCMFYKLKTERSALITACGDLMDRICKIEKAICQPFEWVSRAISGNEFRNNLKPKEDK